MKHFTPTLLGVAMLMAGTSLSVSAAMPKPGDLDLYRFRYQIDTPSVFHNKEARKRAEINSLLDSKVFANKAAAFENPSPSFTLPPANVSGNIDAPDGKIWYYVGQFEYKEIPPHDNVWYTDRILQEYEFTIYDSDLKVIGSIKDKMKYEANEVRVPDCDLTPIATRNFFNTDDKIEIIVNVAVNIEGGGNNYRSIIYSLDGTKDAEGFDTPIRVMDDLVADVVQGPSTDGSDNFYITFMNDVFDEVPEDASFWDYLLAQKEAFNIYAKATDDSGPRLVYSMVIPVIEFPGDQQDSAPMMSMRRGDEVIYCFSKYKEPFYNRYDDPMSEDMTMREGNSLVIDLYKMVNDKLEVFSTTEIPMTLDRMPDSGGNATCLFSYYGIGTLRYTGDILFDAPGANPEKPGFIVTRGNYQTSTDAVTNSYFTYNNDGTLKNTLCLYADGTLQMGNLEGFEPQQLFITTDPYGYVYNFVDIYSGKTASKIDANYYYDDDSDSELLSSTVARVKKGDSYKYVFELRYPIVDDNENDLLRFMHINKDGSFDYIDYVNMGKGIAYAQSYLTTEALQPHAYTDSDNPAYMMLVKRTSEDNNVIEQLMVAEAQSEEYPEGKTLLQLGPNENGPLSSIVPEFAIDSNPGRLFVYYYNSESRKVALDVYALPLAEGGSGVTEIKDETPGISVDGSMLVADGEIRIYNLDGKLIVSGNGSVEFASLQPGVYVVNAGGKSYKILK